MPGAGSDDTEPAARPDVDHTQPPARPAVRRVARRAVPDAGGSSVLPDTTADETDIGWGEVPEPDDDERYLREVPPHHGS